MSEIVDFAKLTTLLDQKRDTGNLTNSRGYLEWLAVEKARLEMAVRLLDHRYHHASLDHFREESEANRLRGELPIEES